MQIQKLISKNIADVVLDTMNQLQSFYTILQGSEEPLFLLKGLRTFWAANNDFWFSHAPISTWEIVHTTYKDDLETNIHLLLHYDQIIRHPMPALTTPMSQTNKECAHRFATAIALRMLHNGQYATAEPWERVFILLTLRHGAAKGLKTLALRKCLAEAEADPSPLWCRFLAASVWAIHEWREKTVGYPAEAVVDLDSLHTFSALLEAPLARDVSTHMLVQAMNECIHSVGGERIAVSVSGGVDSMVAAYLAAAACKATGKELVLLHISYKNREECEDECNLVRWFGTRLGVSVYIRRITEIQRIRASGLRATYEEVTRRIRFAFYRHFGCPVILGHNQDDCLENVFRNLSQRIHFDNLLGMSSQSEEQGVVVLRPFLGVAKGEILAYADREGIPHLYDSTPAWSQRGRMRDTLIPTIHAFDAGILGGLLEMVERSRFLESQWSLGLLEWLGGIVGNVVVRDAFLERNRGQPEFWVRVFRHLGVRPSNKSIRNFMEMLDRGCEGRCTEMPGHRLESSESSEPKILRCNLNGSWVAHISNTRIKLLNNKENGI